MDREIKLGDKVKDRESEFAGKVIGRSEHLYSPPQLLVATGKVVDGKPVDEWIEEARIQKLDQ